MSLLVDLALGGALAMTSATVLLLHRRLRRLGSDLATYRSAIRESSAALETARQALRVLVDEGREVVFALAARIDEAKTITSPSPDDAGRPAGQPLASSLRRLKSFVPAGDRHS
jgi:hypothetical protein